MENILGIISLITNEKVLGDLTLHRTLAAVPIGGRYRIIDFSLSNMVNSGIREVGIFAHNRCGSLISHLGDGIEWDLNRKRDGLFILLPDYFQYPLSLNKWDIAHFYSHLNYIQSRTKKYVVISGCNMICSLDYRDAFKFHQITGADITIIYKKLAEHEKERFFSCISLETEDDGRIYEIKINPGLPAGSKVCAEMFILSKTLLLDLIDDCITRGCLDLVIDGFAAHVKDLKIYGYHFPGYLAKINSINSYYRHNLDLLNPKIWHDLFFQRGVIFTKIKDSAPTKYTEESLIRNVLAASDCIIEGKVEDSVIFRGVRVGKDAWVKDSIILEGCMIEDNAVVYRAILDKEVRITRGKVLNGKGKSPVVVRKRSVL